MTLVFLTPLAGALILVGLGLAILLRLTWRGTVALLASIGVVLALMAVVAFLQGPACGPDCAARRVVRGDGGPVPDTCTVCCQAFPAWYCYAITLGLCDCEGGEGQ